VKNPPLISIVIPVKNGIDTIKECLDGIFSQTLINQTEVIIIDSGSTDGTLDVIKKYEVKLIPIAPQEFNHGETRNLGVTHASGKFVLMTVQDAIAIDNQWLQRLINNFDTPSVAGVCGQQYVPQHKDKNPFEWYRPISEPKKKCYSFNQNEFASLTPASQREVCGWDDVNAMYRRDALIATPFKKVKFGEDLLWAKNILSQGYIIAYDPSCKVQHYHHVTYNQEVGRKLVELLNDYVTFNLTHRKVNIIYQSVLYLYRVLKYKIPVKWYIYQIKKDLAYNRAIDKFTHIKNTLSKTEINSQYFTNDN
jgi:rhamnosyltransferase